MRDPGEEALDGAESRSRHRVIATCPLCSTRRTSLVADWFEGAAGDFRTGSATHWPTVRWSCQPIPGPRISPVRTVPRARSRKRVAMAIATEVTELRARRGEHRQSSRVVRAEFGRIEFGDTGASRPHGWRWRLRRVAMEVAVCRPDLLKRRVARRADVDDEDAHGFVDNDCAVAPRSSLP